jgi:hypothetical protein
MATSALLKPEFDAAVAALLEVSRKAEARLNIIAEEERRWNSSTLSLELGP